MENEIIIEPAIGDAILKKETITYEQMREEIKQENLLHNPEMNTEMKIKWNKERQRYFKDGY